MDKFFSDKKLIILSFQSQSFGVEGHLTYPENGELCNCKEGGNPRHDVAKPECESEIAKVKL